MLELKISDDPNDAANICDDESVSLFSDDSLKSVTVKSQKTAQECHLEVLKIIKTIKVE